VRSRAPSCPDNTCMSCPFPCLKVVYPDVWVWEVRRDDGQVLRFRRTNDVEGTPAVPILEQQESIDGYSMVTGLPVQQRLWKGPTPALSCGQKALAFCPSAPVPCSARSPRETGLDEHSR
jgi:hypothetical protein